jgi:hypothetical protein
LSGCHDEANPFLTANLRLRLSELPMVRIGERPAFRE